MEGAIKLVKRDPSSAVSLCISAANTPTSSPCVTRKSRHSAEMDSAKVSIQSDFSFKLKTLVLINQNIISNIGLFL